MILALTLGLSLTAGAFAGQLTVADGSSSGTYAIMVKQMNQVVGADMVELAGEDAPHGAIDNLDALTNNRCQLAMLHSDVISYRAQSEDQSFHDQYKTLVALYPEDVHFLVLNKPVKLGGHTAFGHTIGGTDVNLQTISDLKDMKIGAAGGGFVTANVINLLGQIHCDIVKYGSGAEVIAALNNGEVQCAVFVGAAPLPNIEKLGSDYRLIGVSDTTAQMLKSVYRTTTISYPKIQTEAVHTIAPTALLVARVYKTAKFVSQLKEFRRSFNAHLDEIKETPGMHKCWQKVDSGFKGPWDYYNLQ